LSNSTATPQAQTTPSTETGVFVRTLRSLLLRSARISKVETVAPHFRLIELWGNSLKAVNWSAGNHIQIVMGSGLAARTYTPMSWNADIGKLSILVFLHGNGPGCEWVRAAKENDPCAVTGARRSLGASSSEQPIILFGDETCFGLAVALKDTVDPENLRCVFEVSDLAESRTVLHRFGLSQAILIQRSGDNAHLEQVSSKLAFWVTENVLLALTGNARSIQTIKKNLSTIGLAPRQIKVKPYWSPGKTGLN
jgi:ferric-chelate reductase (NADPH)